MGTKTKRTLISMVAVGTLLLLLFLLRPDPAPSPEPLAAAEEAPLEEVASPTPLPASPRAVEPAPQTSPDAVELMDELLGYLESSAPEQKIILAGEELMSVEGGQMEEDPVSGNVIVHGIQRVRWTDGREVFNIKEGVLKLDPHTGHGMIEAESLEYTDP